MKSPGRLKIYSVCLAIFCLISAKVGGQELPELLGTLEEQNPELRAAELKADAQREAVNESRGLEKTQFGLGYALSEPETRTGPQELRISLMQMLPWFGTLKAREDLASSQADQIDLMTTLQRRKLVRELSREYYELASLAAKKEVVEKNIQLVQDYEELALTAVEVANASAVDVIRLQLRLSELQERLQALEYQRLAQQARVNRVAGRPAPEPVATPGSLVDLPLPEVNIQDLVSHPEIAILEEQQRGIRLGQGVNRKETAPTLALGLDYILVGERMDANPMDNGKDIVMPMVSLGVPLFSPQYRSRARQLELQESETEIQREAKLLSLQEELEILLQQANIASLDYRTRQENIEQVEDALEILLTQYEGGQADFTQVLDLQQQLLSYQLRAIDALADRYKVEAGLEYLTGTGLRQE